MGLHKGMAGAFGRSRKGAAAMTEVGGLLYLVQPAALAVAACHDTLVATDSPVAPSSTHA
jgi:hypothetical protein